MEATCMASHPRVTVFIPAHNREDYIRCAIDSILGQDFTDFELLVVDDGSTDRTCDLVSAYQDPRVRLERNSANLGIPATRNRGLELARGEYIALLDSDDYAYPSRLRRQVAFLDHHPQIAQVGSWCSLMDADGQLLRRIRRHPTRPEDVDAHLLFHCSLINRTILARTARLRAIGYDESFPRCQDYELHARLAEQHLMANMPEILVCGREHDGRITRNTVEVGRNLKMRIQARLLDQLGMRFDDADLDRHYGLTQKPGEGGPADLEWVERWLLGLLTANDGSRRYPRAALQRAVGLAWAATCWFHREDLGWRWPAVMAAHRLGRRLPDAVSAHWLAAEILPVNRRALAHRPGMTADPDADLR